MFNLREWLRKWKQKFKLRQKMRKLEEISPVIMRTTLPGEEKPTEQIKEELLIDARRKVQRKFEPPNAISITELEKANLLVIIFSCDFPEYVLGYQVWVKNRREWKTTIEVQPNKRKKLT